LFLFLSLFRSVVDEIAVLHEFADQGIDLLQTEWGLWAAFQIATHEAVFFHAYLQRCGAGLINRGRTILFG
jgi:hypothetical protein